jgi:hypothetical protein
MNNFAVRLYQTVGAIGSSIALFTTLLGCARKEEPPVVSQPIPQAVKHVPVLNFQTLWQDESQYIVETVASDLTEMAYFAKHRQALDVQTLPAVAEETSAPNAKTLTYHVTMQLASDGTLECDLPITTPIWSPITYRPLVRALFSKLQLKSGDADNVPPSGLLHTLSEPKADVIAEADRSLSKKLTGNFASAATHEEAALLLASFALRENSGMFFQIRFELCRIAAHLAFAQGLRGDRAPTIEGQFAEVALVTLYNNQVTALGLMRSIPDNDETSAWKRALRMRATGDYRIIAESDTPTLLEKIEWFRARAHSVSVDRAWADLRLRDDWKPLADWSRTINSNPSSVEVGHAALATGLRTEFREYGLVHKIETGFEPNKDEFVDTLNADPERCVVRNPDGSPLIQVIGWGTWAAFLQRHLCNTMRSDFNFLQYIWAVKDRALDYRNWADGIFSGLRLYPMVRRQNATDEAYYRKAQDDTMALVHRSPQVVPAEAWNYVCYTVPFAPLYIPPPHAFINEWHKHNPPPGTAYNPLPRLNHPSLTNQPDTIARIEYMHALAPYDEDITFNLLRIRDGDNPTAEQLQQAYAAVLDFQPFPCSRIAGQYDNDPQTYGQWMNKAAVLDPSYYETLAKFYVEQGREADAANAYIQWIANGVDEVAIANDSGWLVDYFERTGHADNATQLANRAAETYSSRGLLVKARLLERRHEYDDALKYYQAIYDRYDEAGDIIGFLYRLKTTKTLDANQAALLTHLMKVNVPEGINKVTIDGETPPPQTGVIVNAENNFVRDAGLQRDDVIVAIRGYQVTSWKSYVALRALDPDAPITLTIWRDSHYFTSKPLPAGFRFGMDLGDYRAR